MKTPPFACDDGERYKAALSLDSLSLFLFIHSSLALPLPLTHSFPWAFDWSRALPLSFAMKFSLAVPAVVGFATLVSANAHAHAGAHLQHLPRHHSDVATHHNDPRTLCLISGIIGNILPGFGDGCGGKYPDRNWQCSGSGGDGWE